LPYFRYVLLTMKTGAALSYERAVSHPQAERMVYEVLRDKGRKPCRPFHERMRELEDSVSGGANLPEGSLRFAAQYFQKTTRTIRTWCAMNVFPTATRTAGGHWRIPFDDIMKATTPANSRAPKTTLGLRGRKQFLSAPMKLLLVFRSMIRAAELATPLSSAEKKRIFDRLMEHINPISSDTVLRAEVGRLWVQAEFERLEELLQARSWQDAPTSEARGRARGFSVAELARTAGVDRATVYRWRKTEPWLDSLIRELQRRVRAGTKLGCQAG
jgi:hypothetical protein